jgi:hypothetical protein
VIPVFVAVAVAAEPSSASASADAVRSHLDQARLFIKKEWYDDAQAELEAATSLPDGRIDPEAWYLLATVRYELCDIEGALAAAERAHSYSRTDDQLQLAAGLEAFLAEQFGIVDVRAPYESLAGRLDIVLDSTLFDPTLKLYLERLKQKYDKKLVFPVRIGLPAGTYRINGEQVVVAPNQRLAVEIPAGALAPGGAAGQLAQLEIAAGAGFWLGAEASHWLPSLSTEIGVSQPIGPVVAGIVFDWSPALFTTQRDRVATSPVSWTLGGRIGVDVRNTGAVGLRPSLGYRYGYLPGVERPCVADGDGFACSTHAQPDLVVYAIGRAHVVFAEIDATWLDRRRKSGLGFGVKVVGEQAIGTLPRQAQASLGNRTVDYRVASGSRSWTATGVRFLLDGSIAF